ncbi:MAG: hypothetical protein DWB44_12150 [Chloroflexi bacterium]|jgi:uncharacterized membrane protein (UPF0127 family)|nr:MAG: hypothetical protein UZ13_00764 [Chloroflexi bacterium OLB13]MBC6956924.1 hypothetical protein [Chloroflexota bacterium]MBV6435849.1 hypothetical protein [Anaerolineae bacterium]MDL1916493.1 hypothetical protein [Anaerolineae bacterium CFX4]OQY78288.1 MAG: hypothetical protein B6D42_16170 [Anaerolineae bacterium UTCFX5]
MSDYRVLRNTRTGEVVLGRARWCASFLCHFVGLMGRAGLPQGEGLLFVTGRESKAATTIHMFFMRFTIGVVWLAKDGRVVDKAVAKPWRPAYAPKAPAQYYVEANVSVLDSVEIGDVLTFSDRTT